MRIEVRSDDGISLDPAGALIQRCIRAVCDWPARGRHDVAGFIRYVKAHRDTPADYWRCSFVWAISWPCHDRRRRDASDLVRVSPVCHATGDILFLVEFLDRACG